jgi:hypothetical protein
MQAEVPGNDKSGERALSVELHHQLFPLARQSFEINLA